MPLAALQKVKAPICSAALGTLWHSKLDERDALQSCCLAAILSCKKPLVSPCHQLFVALSRKSVANKLIPVLHHFHYSLPTFSWLTWLFFHAARLKILLKYVLHQFLSIQIYLLKTASRKLKSNLYCYICFPPYFNSNWCKHSRTYICIHIFI